jgi:hypothetical protein
MKELDAEVAARLAWSNAMRANYDALLRSECDWTSALSVYADCLLQDDDPHGELIAMDLAEVSEPHSVTIRSSDRQTLERRWLGRYGSHPDVKTNYGMVQIRVSESSYPAINELLARPQAKYIEAIFIDGPKRFIRHALEDMFVRDYPWMGRLSLVSDDGSGVTALTHVCSVQVNTYAPHLHSLRCDGHLLADEICDLGITFLRLDGESSVVLQDDGATFEKVVAVDIDLGPAYRFNSGGLYRLSLSAQRFPRLSKMDLSRNTSRRLRDVCEYATAWSVVPKLRMVKFPVLRDVVDKKALEECLRSMSNVEVVEVAGVYGDSPISDHQRALFRHPDPKPWFHRDDVDASSLLTLSVGGETYQVELLELCHVLENRYARLEVGSRNAWQTIWSDLRLSGRAELAGSVWEQAMVPCLDAFLAPKWKQFIESCPPNRAVDVVVDLGTHTST